MTGYVTVIGGVNGSTPAGASGIVSVPSTLSQASVTQPGSFLNTVQNFLGSVSDSVLAGNVRLINNDVVAGTTSTFNGSQLSGGGIYEVTNTDSVGTTTAGSVSVSVTVPTLWYQTVVVEAPGSVSVAGNGEASTYVLGSATNAVVSTNGSTSVPGSANPFNTIYGLGGNDTIYAAGDNQATFVGGVDRYKVLNGSSTVVAAGNATVQAGVPTGYTGTIDFINESTAQATVFGEAGQVTAYGGAAGGLFYGGTGGSNSLVGGAGMATLVGSGSGDTLEAGFTSTGGSIASALNNYLFAGAGNETLIASAGTQNNLIALGTGSDAVSAEGSGNQYFFSANSTVASSAEITGTASATGGTNIYFLGTSLNGAQGIDYIENWSSVNSHLYAVNGDVISSIGETTNVGGGAGYTQQGALVTLSDGTQVVLVGVSSSNLSGTGSPVLNYT